MEEEPIEFPEAPPDPFNGIPNIQAITERAVLRTDDALRDRGQSALPGYHISASANSWLAKRQMARTVYAGRLEHRAVLGGVFSVGNLSLRTMSRIISLRAAQQAASLLGSEPFMQAMPAKIADAALAKLCKQAEAKIQQEIAGSNMRMALAEGIRVALCEGERAHKITYERDTTSFPDSAEVAVDEMGAPLKTPKGEYIYRKDDLITVVVDELGQNLRKAQTDPDGAPIEQLQPGEQIQIRLKKEPAFIFTAEPVWQTVDGLMQTLVHRDGLHCAGLFCEDFIWPPNVPSLDDEACDIMVHRYDAVMASVAQKYANAGFVDERKLFVASTPQSYAGQALENAGEEGRSTATQETICIHETYFRAWITPEDGSPPFETWLFIVIDWTTRLPIYAQYLGRMKMKRPPFFLLRGLESEPGRAYGVGISDKCGDRDLMIDVWWNRAAQKSSMTNSITCAHVDGLEAVRDQEKIIFGSSKVYRILAGSEYGESNKPVFRVNLSEMSDHEFELLRETIASAEAEFGVVDASGNNSENERGQQVATAVRNIERTGNTLNEASTAMQATDLQKGLEIAVNAILQNMDEEELQFIPGEDALFTLNRDEILNLDREIKIISSKAKGADLIEVATAAKNTLLEYVALPKAQQKIVRDQFVETLKALQVPDADEKCKEPTDEEIQAEAEAPVQPQPPSVTVSLSDLEFLAPSERDQFLQKYFGVQGADPSELAMMAKQKHSMEMEQAKLKLMKAPEQEKGGSPTNQEAAA